MTTLSNGKNMKHEEALSNILILELLLDYGYFGGKKTEALCYKKTPNSSSNDVFEIANLESICRKNI